MGKFGHVFDNPTMKDKSAYTPTALSQEIEADPPQEISESRESFPEAGVKLLNDAAEAISTSRNETHGKKETCFTAMAEMDGMLKYYGFEGTPESAALRMILYKVARIIVGQSDFEDHWKDIAGYAACGWECIEGRKKDDEEILTFHTNNISLCL